MADLKAKLTRAEADLVEAHSQIERLGRERERLETYSRESIQTFKKKFTNTLQTVNEEKEMLEGALERLADRCEFDRETYRREERLLLSALHSLGVESAPPHTVRHAVMPMSIGAAAGVLLGAACVAISVRQTLRQTRVDGSARLGLRKS